MSTHLLAQALRRSHCSREGQEHNCAGTCTITPGGLELSCALCGGDKIRVGDRPGWKHAERRAKAMLEAAGLQWGHLSAETQARVIEQALRDHCPGCGRETLRSPEDAVECACGKWWRSPYRGWHRREDA